MSSPASVPRDFADKSEECTTPLSHREGKIRLDARLLRDTFDAVAGSGDRFAAYFYAVLFIDKPELRQMFPVAMDTQRARFLDALRTVTERIERPEALRPYLERLAIAHRKYNVKPEHFNAVGRALIAAFRRFGGSLWTPEAEKTWMQAYIFMARTMITAIERGSATQPGVAG